MIKIYGLGACNEVGRSAFLVEYENQTLLLDYGVKLFGDRGRDIPEYPLPFPKEPNLALISHSHLDHIGHVPALFTQGKKVPWYATPPTVDIGEILWKDTLKLAKLKEQQPPFMPKHIEKAKKHWHPIIYNQWIKHGSFSFRFTDAGHILGSSMVTVKIDRKRIVYTGDFKGSETRLLKPAKHPGEADIWITEGTYWDRDHPPRKEVEEQLIGEIEETIENGGNAIVAAFAVGRTQELISVIRDYIKDVPIYVDGMGKEITKIHIKYPGFVKNIVDFQRKYNTINIVENARQRKSALKEPSIIVTTAGMLEGGPVLYYIMNANPNSKIILTGYQVKGTNGDRLLNEGKMVIDEYELDITLPVAYVDFSAHAGRSEIIEYMKKANPSKVIVVHSDNAKGFAQELRDEEGFDAIGIKRGEELKLRI